jgi:MarR family 2-MHQ and catechol resistance regulon transcriptional repressor
MEPYFARYGISGSQWAVLRTLYRAEKEGLSSLRLTDLGERLLVRPPSVTSVVDRLSRLGLVSRNPSSTDLRTKHVHLTNGGREVVDRVLVGHRDRVRAIFGGLSLVEQKELHELLDRVGCEMEKLVQREEDSVVYS